MIDLGDQTTAENVFKALLPEVESPVDEKRGKINIQCYSNKVVITVYSNTLSNIRALLNTYAYLLESLTKVVINKL